MNPYLPNPLWHELLERVLSPYEDEGEGSPEESRRLHELRASIVRRALALDRHPDDLEEVDVALDGRRTVRWR